MKESDSNLSHMAIQLFQHHLLKKLFFPPLNWHPCWKRACVLNFSAVLHLSFLLSVHQIPSSSQTTFSSSFTPCSSTHPYFPTFFLSVLNATPHFVCYPEDQLKWNLLCLVFVALPAAHYLVFQNVLLFILDHYLVIDNSSIVKKTIILFLQALSTVSSIL